MRKLSVILAVAALLTLAAVSVAFADPIGTIGCSDPINYQFECRPA